MFKSKKMLAGLAVVVALGFGIQKNAEAYVDTTGEYLRLLAGAGALGAGGAATLTAAGTVLGLSPFGWLAIGTVALASVFLRGDTAVVVSTKTIDQDPNEDLDATAGTEAPTTGRMYVSYASGVPINYAYFTQTGTDVSVNAQLSMTVAVNGFLPEETARMTSRLDEWLKAKGFSRNLTSANANYPVYYYKSNTSTQCPSGRCAYLYYDNNTKTGTIPTTVKTQYIGGSTYFVWFDLTQGVGYECPGGQFDYASGLCMKQPTNNTISGDKVCKISWSVDGCPIFSPFDSDCAGVSKTCGSSTEVPKITVSDPNTGAQLEVERPRPGQTNAGNTVHKHSKPDPTTGTTRLTTQTVNNVTNTTQNITNNYYQGTNPTTPGTTITQVAITNWPEGLTSAPNITVSPNITVAPQVAVNVQGPETMKIDNEGKTGELGTWQTPTEKVESLLDPVKEKLAGVLNFKLPAHASSCPALNIDWHVFAGKSYAQHYVVQSNFMCDWLEQNKQLLASIAMFVYVSSAIIIVLKA